MGHITTIGPYNGGPYDSGDEAQQQRMSHILDKVAGKSTSIQQQQQQQQQQPQQQQQLQQQKRQQRQLQQKQ